MQAEMSTDEELSETPSENANAVVGNAWSSRFFTRTQSLKKLQVSLKSFRQLCIYKGIHPRVPKRTGGDGRVFYHNKDIKFLAHEPTIDVLRKQRKFYRKIRAARQRKDKIEAQRLERRFPRISLTHVMKERYPTFQHALRDLDDPLTMAHLFANLHQQGMHRESSEIHEAAARLCAEFQSYVVRTHSLRKVFVSVKGYYYQADIMGTEVTWCVPHKFVQNFDKRQIDPFIMLCYMEFYKTILGFVNFRLFHSLGIRYPPQLTVTERNTSVALEGLLLRAEIEPSGNLVSMKTAAEAEDDDEDELVEIEEEQEEEEDIGEKAAGETKHIAATDDANLCSKLFSGLVFFLGRETPIDQLVFVIQYLAQHDQPIVGNSSDGWFRSFGGKVAWENDASSFDVSDPRITHCICDRPKVKEEMKACGREYVQPQWIFDCCNARVLLPTDLYAIGKIAPPHLSPFVSAEDEGYVPDYAKEIQRIQDAANLVRRTNDTSAQEQAIAEILADDITFQEEEELERRKKEEEEYVGELELELETEFPTEMTVEVKKIKTKRKKREDEIVEETEKMGEIMVTNKHQYNKLKRREIAKKAKVEKLQRNKAQLSASKTILN